ncbi:MAG TPA: enolase C-terminal domain-like protein [Xanthobacteraceae bacterium]|nr:enolase C-terminal domain-like protein [Xanthobacteraceae bacterium]
MASPSRQTLPDSGPSELRIKDVIVHKLRLPYRSVVNFRSVTQDRGEYVLIRIVAGDGKEGVAEAVCRPEQHGEDAAGVAKSIDTLFKPRLLGLDPLAHLAALAAIGHVKFCRTEKALIDIALWDLKGKILNQPVWRLLGAAKPKPVPLTWLVHGKTTREAMVADALRQHEARGYNSMKLKTWKRSMEDVRLVEDVRKALGDDAFLYVDGNGSYTEGEARTILARVADYNVTFIEEPCKFSDPLRQAAFAPHLPIPLLGDQCLQSLEDVQLHIRLGAVGAVSIKLRRTGFTQSLKIAALAEAAGLPVVIGTDSESRIGSLSRMHLRAALPWLAPYPAETHFFDKLTDDAFAGEFQFSDGTLTPTDAPGFGAEIDHAKLKTFAF